MGVNLPSAQVLELVIYLAIGIACGVLFIINKLIFKLAKNNVFVRFALDFIFAFLSLMAIFIANIKLSYGKIAFFDIMASVLGVIITKLVWLLITKFILFLNKSRWTKHHLN